MKFDGNDKVTDFVNLTHIPELSQWEPIETAPKDGTAILVLVYGSKNAVVRFIDGYWSVYHLETESRFMNWLRGPKDWLVLSKEPTHWMPLPEPPK